MLLDYTQVKSERDKILSVGDYVVGDVMDLEAV